MRYLLRLEPPTLPEDDAPTIPDWAYTDEDLPDSERPTRRYGPPSVLPYLR